MRMFRFGLSLVGLALLQVSPTSTAAINVTADRPGCHGGIEVWNGDTFAGCDMSGGFGAGPREPSGGRDIGGGGGSVVPNPGDTPPPQQNANTKADVDCTVGNPVVVSTGNKIEPEVDFASAGEMPLSLERTYNHFWTGIGIFGRSWISSFDYKLLLTTDSPTSSCYPRPGSTSACNPTNKPIWAQRPDGRKIKFIYKTSPAVGWYEDKPSSIAKILKNGTGFKLYSEDHTVETYDASGFPLTLANEQGVGWTYHWNASHYLTDVTHTSGRKVSFGWTGNQLTSVTSPTGHVYRYTYKSIGVTALAVPALPSALLQAQLLPPPVDPGDPPPSPADPPTTPTTAPLLTKTVQPGVASTANGGTPAITLTYHYEDSRFPSGLTGKTINGTRYSWFSYDANGRAIETKHANDMERYRFSYVDQTSGALTVTVTNPLGKVTVHKYDAKGHETSVTGHASAHCPATYKAREYDSNGYPAASSDFNEVITAYTYNTKGQLTEVREDADATNPARVTTYAWNGNNRLTRTVVAGFSQTDITYTTNGRLASRKLTTLSSYGGAGRSLTTTYAYTTGSNGLVTKLVVTGPSPTDVTTYNYSATGDLTSVVNALGHKVTYASYNALGLPGKVTDANGAVTAFVYDARGRVAQVTEVINGVNRTTKTAYNALSQPTDTWTPDGRHITHTYDAAYRLTKSEELESSTPNADFPSLTDTSTRQVLYTYNANSDVLSVKQQRVYVSWYTRDIGCGDPLVVQTPQDSNAPATDATGAGLMQPMAPPPCTPLKTTTTSVAASQFIDYDELGRPIAVRGNNGQNVRTAYDANGNVVSVTDSANKVTKYLYDVLNRVHRITDPAGGVTWFGYDKGDQLLRVIDPRGRSTYYYPDALGLLWKQISPDTGTVYWTYDSYGRRTSMKRNDGVSTTYGYDALNRLTTVSAGGKTQTLAYDTCTLGKGRLCSAADALSTEQFTYNTQGQLLTQRVQTQNRNDLTKYGYDAYARLAAVTYPSGTVARYSYTLGQVSKVGVTTGSTTADVVKYASYNAAGAPAYWTYGNNTMRSQTYDTDGRLKTLTTRSGTTSLQNYTYSWDATNRITGIANGLNANLSRTLTYDVLGRLTRENAPVLGSPVIMTYDASGNRTKRTWTTAEASTIESTSNRLTKRGSVQYGYNANGQRTSWVQGGTTATYAYDPFNRLTSTTRNTALSDGLNTYPAGTTTYRVNPLGQRVYKKGPAGEYWFNYNPGGQLMADYKTGKGWTDYIYFNGQPVAMVRSGVRYYLYNDHLGRPEIAANSSGTAVWRASNGSFDRNVTTDSIGGLNLGLPGQYFDAETGHWYNMFRNYDGNEGRYLESDPIGLSGGINTYAYGSNNPLQRIDPMGLDDTFCMRNRAMCGLGTPGTPDYVHVSAGLYIGTVSLTYTKNGTLFAGWGAAHSDPKSLVSGKVGLSLTAGKMIGCPKTGDQVDKWATGISTGATAFYMVGGGYSMNAAGTAMEGGIGTPGFSVQAFEDMTPVWHSGLGW